jgi:hypothetical protein
MLGEDFFESPGGLAGSLQVDVLSGGNRLWAIGYWQSLSPWSFRPSQ